MSEIIKLNCIRGDGSHWSLGDWYKDVARGIQEALNQGPSHQWTTGWYSSKKEIASGCITCAGGKITCEASVSDDFDTEGTGTVTIDFTTDLEKLAAAMNEAHEQADENKKDNEVYVGFCVLREGRWVETYLSPKGDGHELDAPPGDNYGEWGWQGESEDIPDDVRNKLAKWADQWDYGTNEDDSSLTVGEWTIKPWSDE